MLWDGQVCRSGKVHGEVPELSAPGKLSRKIRTGTVQVNGGAGLDPGRALRWLQAVRGGEHDRAGVESVLETRRSESRCKAASHPQIAVHAQGVFDALVVPGPHITSLVAK